MSGLPLRERKRDLQQRRFDQANLKAGSVAADLLSRAPQAGHRRSRFQHCVTVANWVAKFDLGRALYLTTLALAMGSRVDFKSFAEMITRNADVHTTSDVFESGHSLAIGCQTEDHAMLTALLLRRAIFHATNQLVGVYNFGICNLVCRIELPYSVPLDHPPGAPLPPTGGLNVALLAIDAATHPYTVSSDVDYDPVLFHGLRWRVRLPLLDPKTGELLGPDPNGSSAMMILFARGRGVGTGMRTQADADRLNRLVLSLESYERGHEYREMTEREKKEAAATAARAKSSRKRATAAAAAAEPSRPAAQQEEGSAAASSSPSFLCRVFGLQQVARGDGDRAAAAADVDEEDDDTFSVMEGAHGEDDGALALSALSGMLPSTDVYF